MVAVVGPDAAAGTVERLAARGVPAWVLGAVGPDGGQPAGEDLTRGAKGVDGGAVRLVGEHPA
jgi:phosphoribosylformylglycinamidine cyclo-ligase